MQTAAQQQRVLEQCRREALHETWKGGAGVVLFIVLAVIAAVVVDPAADFALAVAAWIATGAVGNEAVDTVASSVGAWRAVRRMRRDPEYLAAIVEVEAAESRAEYIALGSRDDTTAPDDLYERVAAIQHDIWAHWMRYLLGSKTFPITSEPTGRGLREADVQQWLRQIDTPYADLTEREKASDREQVDRFWPLIAAARPVRDTAGVE